MRIETYYINQFKSDVKTASDENLNELLKEIQDIISIHEENIETYKTAPIICPAGDSIINNSLSRINEVKIYLKIVNDEKQARN